MHCTIPCCYRQVLVCAPSNIAVDQLTEKIHRTGLKVCMFVCGYCTCIRACTYSQSEYVVYSLYIGGKIVCQVQGEY